MGKFTPDAVLDVFLDKVATGTSLMVCSDQPTTRAEAVALALATVTTDNGDFAKANGDSSGRKVTVSAQNGLNVDTGGIATHVAICDGTNLLYVTTCSAQVLTQGNTVNVPSWKVEIADPS